MIDVVQINSGVAVGADGSATANTDSINRVTGEIMAIYVAYNDSPPAGTTDVTIATAGGIGGAQTMLTLTDAATDGWFYPRTFAEDTVGVDLLYAATFEVPTEFVVADKINVKIAQANAADNVDVTILVKK